MKPIEASDAGVMMAFAQKVIIVPGYGMAVAQAQHKVWELCQLLIDRGVTVHFAIHPVAGRMPGHMNVLLAEAGVPYDLIADLDEINAEFETADVALIIGANDVVNPVARNDKSSPIYGMPILNADKAKNVIVIKRGQGAGFSGIENALFYLDNTRMLYGDGQAAVAPLIAAVKVGLAGSQRARGRRSGAGARAALKPPLRAASAASAGAAAASRVASARAAAPAAAGGRPRRRGNSAAPPAAAPAAAAESAASAAGSAPAAPAAAAARSESAPARSRAAPASSTASAPRHAQRLLAPRRQASPLSLEVPEQLLLRRRQRRP